ncbi:MAG: hypothetical protein FJ009_08090 [Chloroflexi bacterium]|nr:hypothetical protein [Chloroflexota bacterium]
MFSIRWILLASTLCAALAVGCHTLPIPLPFAPTPLPPNTLVYDAPTTLTIKTGTLLPGTSIAYQGKTETGQAKILITGLLAPKQLADTVDWQGAPAPNVNLKLTTRVASFDDQAIILAGTARLEIANVTIQPGGAPGTPILEFNAPVTLALKKDEMIPGTKIIYAGATPEGANFLGVEGYPYRKQLDSLQHVGRVHPKVFLRLDLRIVNFSETSLALGGTANIKIEQ